MQRIKKSSILRKYRILELFEGDNGRFSLIRVCFLITIVPVSFLWTVLSVREGKLEDIPNGLCLMMAVLTGGKIGQSIVDKQRR